MADMLNRVKIDPNLSKKLKQFQKAQTKAEEAALAQKPKPAFVASLPSAIICDLDGTLAIRTDARGVYDFLKCETDEICKEVQWIVTLAKQFGKVQVIMLSGREDFYKEQTERWLKKHNVEYDRLIMRRGSDHRRDDLVKKELYQDQVQGKYNVLFAIDDRKRIKRMWVSEGLFVLDVNQLDQDY